MPMAPRGTAPISGAAAKGREQRTRKSGAWRGLSSSFLADAVRETATNHCIDRVVSGSLDGNVAVVSARAKVAGFYSRMVSVL